MYKVCIVGCTTNNSHTIHDFPWNSKRRAEWCRILGIYPRTKNIYLCSGHFSDCYIFGNRVSRFAIPNPPEYRRFNFGFKSNFLKDPLCLDSVKSTMPVKMDDDGISVPSETEDVIEEKEVITEEPSSTTTANEDFQFFSKSENSTGESEDNMGKVEDFEIRKGSTNDMIIKGRYVQTKDYLVVSYTPPKKWTLQQQVHILDEKCSQQLKQIRQQNREIYRVREEFKKHEKLLPKLRHLQAQNMILKAQLKLYKQENKNLRKRTNNKRHDIDFTQTVIDFES